MKALVLREAGGKVAGAIEEVAESQLPAGDVTVAVQYSTLNYKDGLVLGGLGRLVRQYPHVPGVDFVGTVEASDSPLWKKGDAVDPDRLARRRDALGRLRAEGARQG